MLIEMKPVLESLWHLPSAVLGAASVKLLEAGMRWWKQRLQPREEMILLLAYVNHGALQWNQDPEGKVTVPFKLLERRQSVGKDEATPVDYEFEEKGEIGALITKGFMEVVNNGYQRRLTHEGFKKVEALRRSKGFDKDPEISLHLHLDIWFRESVEPSNQNATSIKVEVAKKKHIHASTSFITNDMNPWALKSWMDNLQYYVAGSLILWSSFKMKDLWKVKPFIPALMFFIAGVVFIVLLTQTAFLFAELFRGIKII